MNFTGCKHLDFDDGYESSGCTRQIISPGNVFWMRPKDENDPDKPLMVQFCKLRGRLNYPLACTCEEKKMCDEYEDFTHTVDDLKIC